ncbi:MAG: polysaccharide deacetylase family protein [Ignavibacteriales bacterium]|nr:polysaccharide deacetylase family protein [Ignavibacteriales bacterium]
MIAHTGNMLEFLFPQIIWRMETPGICLTFDDGPHPSATQQVLDVLRSFSVPATFFVTGKNVENNCALLQKIDADGHAIGIHGYQHRRWDAFSVRRTSDEIQRCMSACRRCGVVPAQLYRPPHGFFTPATWTSARAMGLRVILWSTLTGDFTRRSENAILSTVLHRLNDGAILVFHDNDLTTGRINSLLPRCIEAIAARGFSFSKIV